MLKNWMNVAVVTVLAAIALSTRVPAQEQAGTGDQAPASTAVRATPVATPVRAPAAPSAAATAIDAAANADKYIFMFFYQAQDEATQAARATFDAAMEKLADRAMSIAVNVTDPQERVLVAKYQLNRSPMPLVLAMAPTGAVTRSFPGRFTEAQLETAFVSPGMQRCLKALQDRKMAFLCVQNGTTQHNAEAMQGVNEFAADPLYARSTEIITVDPTDAAEESLLKQFKVDPKTAEAVTVFLAPPGRMVGTYTGEIKKDVLVAAVQTAAKGCNPSSGCCAPRKPANLPAQPQRQPQPSQPGGTERQP
jgi:hypothetical protein